MHGRITKFFNNLGVGIIEAENGRKYRFAKREILNSSDPLLGQTVDFTISSSRPTAIIMMAGSPWMAFGGISPTLARE
jgi:hypothetical protein